MARRDVFEVFVEASSEEAARELSLEAFTDLDDPEPYEREVEPVHAQEWDY